MQLNAFSNQNEIIQDQQHDNWNAHKLIGKSQSRHKTTVSILFPHEPKRLHGSDML